MSSDSPACRARSILLLQLCAWQLTLAQNPCEQPGVACGVSPRGDMYTRTFPRGRGGRGDTRGKDSGWLGRFGRMSQRLGVNSSSAIGHQRHANDDESKCPGVIDFSNLEDLWPEKHFRGPLTGRQSYFKRVPPHFLGRHTDFSPCRRRVYIDVGARYFESGLLEMLKLYPSLGSFDEFYLFEAVAGYYKLPPMSTLERQLRPFMTPEKIRTFAQRHFFFQAFIGARSEPSTIPPTIGFSDMLRTMLRLTPSDAVVVKMDVEGFEYDIAATLLSDGTSSLIDELFLEVHYQHPKMRQMFNWCKTPQFWCKYNLSDATTMYQTLRDAGVYTHHWP